MCQVAVNGQPLALHDFRQGAFGLFELAQPAEVVVRTDFDVRWVDIRPQSAGVAAVIGSDHHTVRFRLGTVVPVTVEFNRDLSWVLHLFDYAPEKNPPAPDSPGVHYFGPGVHEAGVIDLRDGEILYLAPGAWLKGHVRSIGTKNVALRGRGVRVENIFVPPTTTAWS
jgi:hypothetical protein